MRKPDAEIQDWKIASLPSALPITEHVRATSQESSFPTVMNIVASCDSGTASAVCPFAIK